jgi:hypothetical protein
VLFRSAENSEAFRRPTTVNSVTDLLMGAWYPSIQDRISQVCRSSSTSRSEFEEHYAELTREISALEAKLADSEVFAALACSAERPRRSAGRFRQ